MSKRPTLLDKAIADLDAQIKSKLAEVDGLDAGRKALVHQQEQQQLQKPAKPPPPAK